MSETAEVDLDRLRRQRSSTPQEHRKRCPECGSTTINRLVDGEGWRCEYYRCRAKFDEPVTDHE